MSDGTTHSRVGHATAADLQRLGEIDPGYGPARDAESLLRNVQEAKLLVVVASSPWSLDIRGFAVYTHAGPLRSGRWRLHHVAVREGMRRCDVGRELVRAVKKNTVGTGTAALKAWARESDLAGQLFLSAVSFRATHVARAFFSDTGEDAYVFQYPPPTEMPK